jgi:alkanesulfonate monooxygenase SsuD/methylene tetrahydromethanopterin reductase-like flavin-dependent oxidoreductase (luciferase family)
MTVPPVRFGLSLTTAHPRGADSRQCVRDLLEQVQTARDVRFHSVWIGDPHVTPYHYRQNLPMIGRISAVSGAMQIGALFMLPLFHPVAEQVATLDGICEGRFTLKTAVGGQQEAHAAFGIPWKERASRFEECLEIVRKLGSADDVSHEGRHWRFSGVSINPKVVAQIEQYRTLGCTHFLFRHIVREQRQVLSSLRLLGEKVLPVFSRAAV